MLNSEFITKDSTKLQICVGGKGLGDSWYVNFLNQVDFPRKNKLFSAMVILVDH